VELLRLEDTRAQENLHKNVYASKFFYTQLWNKQLQKTEIELQIYPIKQTCWNHQKKFHITSCVPVKSRQPFEFAPVFMIDSQG
jgi:CDP-diacylglycerol pyrophosphatase